MRKKFPGFRNPDSFTWGEQVIKLLITRAKKFQKRLGFNRGTPIQNLLKV